jgi:hypothetical protein
MGVRGSSLVRRALLAGLVASLIPAAAYAHRADSGILTICNASGARPATGTFVYTTSTVASAGGTQTFSIPVGTCGAKLFYPLGVAVTVTETVPAGDTVIGITLTPTTGGPGTTTTAAANVSAGSATLTIGTGQATLTFKTSGSGKAVAAPCKVPNVFGLTLTAATTAVRKAHCTVGTVHKAYSNVYYPGIVYSQSPPRGTVLAAHAHVGLTVSLGHH